MSGYRRNALVIDFSVVPTKLKIDKVRDFVFQQMCIDIAQIRTLQTKMTNGQVIIETNSPELTEQLIADHHLIHSLQHEGKSYSIPVHNIDNSREVRIYDLPPNMPNKIIATYFSSYGQVTSFKDDTWKEHFPGVPNGTRILRMRLRKHIPSYVEVAGEMSYVSYKGQIKTCRHCVRALHIGKSCSEARNEADDGSGKKQTIAELIKQTSPPVDTTQEDAQQTSETTSGQMQIDGGEVSDSADETDHEETEQLKLDNQAHKSNLTVPESSQDTIAPVKNSHQPQILTRSASQQTPGPSSALGRGTLLEKYVRERSNSASGSISTQKLTQTTATAVTKTQGVNRTDTGKRPGSPDLEDLEKKPKNRTRNTSK